MLEQVHQHSVPLTDHVKLIKSKKTTLTYITQLSETEAATAFTSYWASLLGRNPWIRLLSAHHAKFANNHDRVYHHNTYGKKIIKIYVEKMLPRKHCEKEMT